MHLMSAHLHVNITQLAVEDQLLIKTSQTEKKSGLLKRMIFSERELKFMFAICHRPSVCRLSVVCNVRAPYSGDSNFRQYFYGM